MELASALSPASTFPLGGLFPTSDSQTEVPMRSAHARPILHCLQSAGHAAPVLSKISHWLGGSLSGPEGYRVSILIQGGLCSGPISRLNHSSCSSQSRSTRWHSAGCRYIPGVRRSLSDEGSDGRAGNNMGGRLHSRCHLVRLPIGKQEQCTAGEVAASGRSSAPHPTGQNEVQDDTSAASQEVEEYQQETSGKGDAKCHTFTSSAQSATCGMMPTEVVRLANSLFISVLLTAVFVVPAHAAVATAEAGKAVTGTEGSAGALGSSGVQDSGGDSGAKKVAETSGGAKRSAEGSGKKTKKAPRVMDFPERREWAKNLPLVKEKIPYTDLLKLKATNQLKAIVKHPNSKLQDHPETCLVVLEDDRVVRTVLPAPERDERFWKAWSDLKIEEAVIDAYTPPPPLPQMEPWGNWGPSLSWLSQLTEKLLARKGAPRKQAPAAAQGAKAPAKPAKKLTAKEREEIAVRERIQRLERERKELEKTRVEREKRTRKEREERVRAEREARARRAREAKEEAASIARMEREQQRRETREEKWAQEDVNRQLEMAAAVESQEKWSRFWASAATNESFRFVLGVLFFVMFYYGVVVNVKKRKQDYEDRVKLEKAAEEERRKLQEWEEEMNLLEDVAAMEATKGLTEKEQKLIQEEEEKNPMLAASRKFMRSGAKVKLGQGARRNRPPQYLDLGDEVRFEDVAGLGDIRRELEEIVDFFTHAERYRRRGSKIPSGILLCGEPGTGKTLLAKAVAGEAGVNFFSISASQFVEIYVGVGASRVRALYNEARENAPAVVFIDELDAVGRQRGMTPGSGGQERDATLNQLLTCLDGFEGKGDVITIAATNRVDILDTALVRPGRFDRKIFVPKPSSFGREQILKVHARKKPMAEDVDYQQVAGSTEGMNGAQLANIVDVAALKVLREGRSEVETDDLLDAAALETGGYPSPMEWSPQRRRLLAFNQAALAAVAAAFPVFSDMKLLTVVPRLGEEKGRMQYGVDNTKFELGGVSRREFLDFITAQLGPMVADEMWHGKEEMSTVWADSTDAARKTARRMVLQGLTDRRDLYGLYETWQEIDRVEAVDREARKILDSCIERATEILRRNRALVDVLVEELLEKGTLHAAEIRHLVETYGDYDEPPPQLEQIRDRHVAEFRQRMIAHKRESRELVEAPSSARGLVEAGKGVGQSSAVQGRMQ